MKNCKKWCRELENEQGVKNAVVFTVLLIPPGRGKFAKEHTERVHSGRYDVTLLIEAESDEVMKRILENTNYKKMKESIESEAHCTYVTTATNVKQIGPVDHTRFGVFLFNYFFADDTEQNLAVWEYTAGWFQEETGLDNSTVLLPNRSENSQYAIINHCRWDHLRDIVPSLLFKKSFHSYVLENFYANNVAPIPILYTLA